MTWFFVCLVAIVLVIGLVFVYNRLVRLDLGWMQARGDVDAQLTQRWDVVPQMWALVQRYMAHETDLVREVTAARAVVGAPNQDPEVKQQRVDGAMAHFFARAEDYPLLKADATFVRMQDAIREVEVHLAAARRAYNTSVMEYNTFAGQFPVNLLAKPLGFVPAEFFMKEDGTQKRPDIATF